MEELYFEIHLDYCMTAAVLILNLVVLTYKWFLNCPFSPGIEEHAGKGQKPSYEGSPALFLCCMSCDNVKHVVPAHLLNRSDSCSAHSK